MFLRPLSIHRNQMDGKRSTRKCRLKWVTRGVDFFTRIWRAGRILKTSSRASPIPTRCFSGKFFVEFVFASIRRGGLFQEAFRVFENAVSDLKNISLIENAVNSRTLKMNSRSIYIKRHQKVFCQSLKKIVQTNPGILRIWSWSNLHAPLKPLNSCQRHLTAVKLASQLQTSNRLCETLNNVSNFEDWFCQMRLLSHNSSRDAFCISMGRATNFWNFLMAFLLHHKQKLKTGNFRRKSELFGKGITGGWSFTASFPLSRS